MIPALRRLKTLKSKFTSKIRNPEVLAYIKQYVKDPAGTFEKYIQTTLSGQNTVTDVDTISPDWKPYEAKYHYNLVENGIIDILREFQLDLHECDVLDIGSGAGHWISFYRDTLQVRSVQGIDFSKTMVATLHAKFSGDQHVDILFGDFTDTAVEFSRKFHIINAIGVIFHIVDDEKWMLAISRMADLCWKNGILIVGGTFGKETRTVRPTIRHHSPARRIRSLKRWKSSLKDNGFEFLGVKRFSWFKGWNGKSGIMDNLLVAQKISGS